jgi:signal transduction histidine kinase
VRTGVNLMTDLLDSLLEFARTRESLSASYGNLPETIQRAIQAVRLHPRHHGRSIDVLCGPEVAGWFDQRKMERVLYNLLLNACEAAPAIGGKIEVTAIAASSGITISVSDNGSGIAESIRQRLFHPFVSYGKENGTGLGLAVVQKIVQDHGGEISVKRTSEGRTIFCITLPNRIQDAAGDADETLESLAPIQRSNANQDLLSHPSS